MTNDEARKDDELTGAIRPPLPRISPSPLQRFNHSRDRSGITIIELIIVIMIILILAGLVLSVSRYVQDKGKRARAETEIAAMSAALESYKADNGIYPRIVDGSTDTLDARTSLNPSSYKNASLYLFTELSGLDAN